MQLLIVFGILFVGQIALADADYRHSLDLLKKKNLSLSLRPQVWGGSNQFKPGMYVPIELKPLERLSAGIQIEAEKLYAAGTPNKNFFGLKYFSQVKVTKNVDLGFKLYQQRDIENQKFIFPNYGSTLSLKMFRSIDFNLNTDIIRTQYSQKYSGSAGFMYRF